MEQYKKMPGSVKIALLTTMAFNPASRVEEKHLKKLMAHITEHGVLNPISIDAETNRIIDGHRRVACAKALGLTEIPCVYYYGLSRNQAKKLYCELNDTARGFKNRDWLTIRHHGGFVPKQWDNLYLRLKDILPPDALDQYIGRGVGMLSTARHAAKRLGRENDKFLKTVLLWMMGPGSWEDLKNTLSGKYDINNRKMESCILNGTPLIRRPVKKEKGAGQTEK